MKPRSFVIARELCAYCGSLLPRNTEGVEAWRVGNRFVCNEFCADGIPDEVAASDRSSLQLAGEIASPLDSFRRAAILK
jgi:hypothetical protein